MKKTKKLMVAFLVLLLTTALFTTLVGAAYNLAYNGTEFPRTGYDYAPSVVVDGTTTKMWWGGQGTDGQDNIYYSYKPSGGSWSTPQVVLSKTGTGWESSHVNDPSVIIGSFTCDGSNYTYAMYYGACTNEVSDCRIGVAFSNDGISWHRYSGNPILRSRNNDITDYGVGLPSAYSTGGSNITLFYFDHSINGATIKVTSTDGINFSSPYRVPLAGNLLGDFTYNTSEQRWYAVQKNTWRSDSDKEMYIYRTNSNSLTNNDWNLVGSITQALTSNWLNHNPGWYRLTNGDQYVSSGTKYIDFGTQTANYGSWDPASWEIGKVSLSDSPDSIPSPGSFNLSSPAHNPTSPTVDPIHPYFSWNSSANAGNYILTVSESSSLDQNDSGETTPICISSHTTTFNSTPTVFNGVMQWMHLLPNKLYYWNVKAVNSQGTVTSTSTYQFRTYDYYSWDFEDENKYLYENWEARNGATWASHNSGIGTVNLSSTNNEIRYGRCDNGEMNPARLELTSMKKVILKIKNRSSADTLLIKYKLTSEWPSAAYHTKFFPIVPNDNTFREYVFDMSSETGWNTGGSRLASIQLVYNASSGSIDYDYIKIAGDSVSRDIHNEYLPVTGVSASSEDSFWNKNMINDNADYQCWKSATYSDENHTEWIKLDLGLVDNVKQVRISPAKSGYCLPKDFIIETSPDGSTWNQVVSYTNAAYIAPWTVNVPTGAQNARYVRLTATKLRNDGSSYFAIIGEITPIRDITNWVGFNNQDFETGTTVDWGKWSPNGDTSHIYVETAGTLPPFKASQYHATIVYNASAVSGSLYRTVSGLTAGSTYTVRVWAVGSNRQAYLIVRNYGGSELSTYTTSTEWAPLTLTVPMGSSNTSMEVHLYAESGPSGSYAYLDNVEIIKQ